MMRDEAIRIIKRGLGFRQTQDAAIIAALKEAQRDLEMGQTLPNWLIEFSFPVVLSSPLVVPVSLPPGFLRASDEYEPYYYASNGGATFLPKRNAREAYDAYASASGGYPQVWVQLTKTTFTFVPIPTALPITLYMTYYKAADLLDSNIENAWLKYAPNYLVGLAGAKVSGDVRDKGAAEKFGIMAKIGQRGLLGDIVEDELSGRPLIMGRNN